jgi:replication factor C subunit 2/4
MSSPWIERYRPFKIDNLIVDPLLMKKIKKIIEDKEMPHMIITGQPGIGKTSTFMCIARELLGDYLNEGLLELNGSDERGIKAKEIIEDFCRKKIGSSKDSVKYHKIVLIDEADNLTQKSQQQINSLISNYQKNTRFAFTCNSSSKIIRAIQSRCIMIRYKRLSEDLIKDRLEYICKNEKIFFEDSALKEISFISNGDLRHAINSLQTIFNAYGEVYLKYVYILCDRPQTNQVADIFRQIIKHDFSNSLLQLNNLFEKGYSCSDLLITMLTILKNKYFDEIDESQRIKLISVLSRYMFKSGHGLDNKSQLMACVSKMFLELKN